jgi:hypothetical protein
MQEYMFLPYAGTLLLSIFSVAGLVNQKIVTLSKCRSFNNIIHFNFKCRVVELFLQKNEIF